LFWVLQQGGGLLYNTLSIKDFLWLATITKTFSQLENYFQLFGGCLRSNKPTRLMDSDALYAGI
jgi:hypothetical protein